jgi:hypothetical protein
LSVTICSSLRLCKLEPRRGPEAVVVHSSKRCERCIG